MADMTTAYETIRAALAYDIDTPDDVLEAALAALAELERAAADSHCELVSLRQQLANSDKVMQELFEYAEGAKERLAEYENAPTVELSQKSMP